MPYVSKPGSCKSLTINNMLMEPNQDFPEKFVPRGAMAFFMLLVIAALIIWFGIYFLMLYRT